MQLLDEWDLYQAYPVRHYRMDNGLETYLVHNPISPVSACMVHYTVGSALESDEERGLAHFFEHMMFRETKTLGDGDIDRIMAEIGGVGLNAFTSYDTTAYIVNVPTPQLGRVFALEADRMQNLLLSPELIEAERGAVLGEINMYQDMPSEQFWNTVMAEAFTTHPYHHPIIGYADQVRGFSDEDFRRFYQTHYAPNRGVIVVAGGFDEDKVIADLETAFSSLPSGSPKPEQPPTDAPWTEDRRREITHEKVSTESLALGWRSPGLEHPDLPALLLLSAVLSAGQSSPLYQTLVWENLATHASASVMETDMMLAAPAMFLIDAGLQHEVEAERAEVEVIGILETLVREGIPSDALERGRNQMRLGSYNSLRSNMGLARQIGGFAVACGRPALGQMLLAAMDELTSDHLVDVLRRYFIDAHRLTVIQRPTGGRTS